MTVGIVEQVEVSEFYRMGRKMKCSECLYGNRNNCPAGITKMCSEHLAWLTGWKYKFTRRIRDYKMNHDQTLFFEIIDNEGYFDRGKDENGVMLRWYVYCDVCGYLPYTTSAFNECKSKGHHVAHDHYYSEMEIFEMKEEKKYADWLWDSDDE